MIMYLMTVASEDVESQRKGFIKIMHPSNPSVLGTSFPGPEDRKMASRMNRSMPIRMVAFHLCAPDTMFFRMMCALIQVSMTGEQKYRINTHIGK